MVSALDRVLVIKTAREVVERSGYESLSLRRLASELGVTAPALYAHVENKSDLLQGVATEGFKELGSLFATSSSERAIERLEQNALNYVTFATDHPELFRVMFLFRPADIEVPGSDELAAATVVFESGFADIHQAIADGDLPSDSPEDITIALWTATHGVASVLNLLGPGFDGRRADTLARTVIGATISGLNAPR